LEQSSGVTEWSEMLQHDPVFKGIGVEYGGFLTRFATETVGKLWESSSHLPLWTPSKQKRGDPRTEGDGKRNNNGKGTSLVGEIAGIIISNQVQAIRPLIWVEAIIPKRTWGYNGKENGRRRNQLVATSIKGLSKQKIQASRLPPSWAGLPVGTKKAT